MKRSPQIPSGRGFAALQHFPIRFLGPLGPMHTDHFWPPEDIEPGKDGKVIGQVISQPRHRRNAEDSAHLKEPVEPQSGLMKVRAQISLQFT